MKKALIIFLVIILAFALVSCGNNEENNQNNNEQDLDNNGQEEVNNTATSNVRVEIIDNVVALYESDVESEFITRFHYDGDTYQKTTVEAIFLDEETAILFKNTVEEFEMYENFVIDGTKVTCELKAGYDAEYSSLTKEELKEILENQEAE